MEYLEHMPSYPYHCEEHGDFTVKFTSFALASEFLDSAPCQQCGHTAKRILTAPALHFLGSGWTDPVPSGRPSSRVADPTKVAAEVSEQFKPQQLVKAVKESQS